MSEILPAEEPVPARVGDEERDQAVAALQTHLSKGRLTADEFDQRISAALVARTEIDLRGLFTDLPAPRPDFLVRTVNPDDALPVARAGQGVVERREQHLYTFLIAAGVMWAAFVAFLFATNGMFWWTAFFVAGATGALARYCGLSDGKKSGSERDTDEG